MSAAECCEEKEILKDRFESAASIHGIRSMHAAVPSGIDSILMKTVSGTTSGSTFKVISKKRTQKVHRNDNGKKSLRNAKVSKK